MLAKMLFGFPVTYDDTGNNKCRVHEIISVRYSSLLAALLMLRINTNRKAALAAVYWAMITIAMPQLAVLGKGVHAASFIGHCLSNAETLTQSSARGDIAGGLGNAESNGETSDAPASPQINSWTPEEDLFVVTLEKQILEYIDQEISQQHALCALPISAYAELIIQLPTQPTLRRWEVMIQV